MEAVAESSPFDSLDAKKLHSLSSHYSRRVSRLFRAEGTVPSRLSLLPFREDGRMRPLRSPLQCPHPYQLTELNGVRLKISLEPPPWRISRGSLIFKDGHLNLNNRSARAFQLLTRKNQWQISSTARFSNT